MNTRLLIRNARPATRAIILLAIFSIALPLLAQDPGASPSIAASPSATSSAAGPSVATSPIAAPSDQPNEAEMMKLAKLNENHKLLAGLTGTWSYNIQMWMTPSAPPSKSSGTSVTRSIMDGRYFVTDVTGHMKMPGSDGKMKEVTFKGMGMDGYDNVKKKFVSSWGDNFSTGILLSEGDYDPATKTVTYTAEEEMIPGIKTKVREALKIVDKDHHTLEWYEDRGGQEVKTMEINYTRKK